jgi:hypothetical protein
MGKMSSKSTKNPPIQKLVVDYGNLSGYANTVICGMNIGDIVISGSPTGRGFPARESSYKGGLRVALP